MSDTLNVFDNSETRTPMLVAYALYERAGCAGGGKGALVQTDKVGTLKPDNYQVIFQPVISIDRAGFNQGVNAKYDIEISDNGITPPLVARGASSVAYASTNKQSARSKQDITKE